MNDTARRLRALIPVSTDPDWHERMARDAESAASRPPPPTRPGAIVAAPQLSDSISSLSDPVNTAGGTRRSVFAFHDRRRLD